MPFRRTSFWLLGGLPLVIFTLLGGIFSGIAPGTPAPKSKPYALLYIPKKADQYETIRNRRCQFASAKSRSTLYAAIRSLKGVELPLLPKRGKGRGVEDDHDDDVAWLAQHLQIEYLDGTGVLRIALAAGTPREQALLVNAVVHGYFQKEVQLQQERLKRALEAGQQLLVELKKTSAVRSGEEKEVADQRIVELKDKIKRMEEALRTLPQLLELSDVPPK